MCPHRVPPMAMAGARNAQLDALRFIPVPDAGTRVSGVQARDYDFAESIPGDLYPALANDKSLQIVINGGALFWPDVHELQRGGY